MSQRGRPRSFDRDAALEAAMMVFWERGYEGTGMDHLTQAMGISLSSLYGTFGDKESLFLATIERFLSDRGSYSGKILAAAPTAQLAFKRLFETAAFELTRTDQPIGCMLTLAIPHCSPDLEPLRAQLNERRVLSLDVFINRIRAGIAARELPASTDAEALARYLMTVLQGMSLQARAGATREDLLKAGRLAMRSWPGPSRPHRSRTAPEKAAAASAR